MLHAKFQNFECIPKSLFPRNGQNMALLWPKHGPHMVLQVGSSWILVIVPRDVKCHSSHCWVYPVAPFPRISQNKVLLCSKHCPHLVLKIGPSLISIIVPRGVPCQNSHCWVYPVAPFPRNGQNIAIYGQSIVLTWPLKLVLYGQNMVLTWSF